MDQPQSEDDGGDLHQLIDSGTESITESPVLEEESEQSEDLTVCDIRSESPKTKEKLHRSSNLLDKSFSIDEDILAPPLEPAKPPPNNNIEPSNSNNSIDKNDFNEAGSSSMSDISKSDTDNELDADDGINEEFFLNERSKKTMQISKELSYFSEKTSIERDLDGAKIFEFKQHLCEEFQFGDDSCKTIKEGSFSASPLSSILRRVSCFDSDNESPPSPPSLSRRVSFPTEESELVTYKEPEDSDQWMIHKAMPKEKILEVYQNSCKKHKTIELHQIKNQIQDIKNNTDHSATLNLSSVNITSEVNETLEDLLKVANFNRLILHECKFTSETMNEFLNMLEYYESVCHIEVAMHFTDDDTWKCFCRAVSNINVLESLSFKGMEISDQYMRNLIAAINNNSNITILKFDQCILVNLPNFYLIEQLMHNKTIRELYLPTTALFTKEADILGRFLQRNHHLKVLDISNNFIGDRGFEALAKGLCNQNNENGLSVLNVFNNQITERSGPIISSVIRDCKSLHTLNIGYNHLTDEVLISISATLPLTKTLNGLGLQNTLLTNIGMTYLAKAIQSNKSLQKINLKGNKAIQTSGVEKLCQALINTKIVKIEIDENNRSCNDPEAYNQSVIQMHQICTVNKSNPNMDVADEKVNTLSQKISRKVSLSCEPCFVTPQVPHFQVGSPMPSPASSPAIKTSRFQIVKVQESALSTSAPATNNSRPRSRFRVTPVPTPSEEDEPLSSTFANVRSSVSSNGSVESLPISITLDSDADDSEDV